MTFPPSGPNPDEFVRHVVSPVAASTGAGMVDHDGVLHRALGADRPTLVVIRPDGYIGLVARAPFADALHSYGDRLRGLSSR